MTGAVATHDLGTDRIPRVAWALVGTVALAAVAVAVGVNAALPAYAGFVAMLVVVAEIDTRELRIPNAVLAPAALASVPLLALATTAGIPGASLARAGLGALALGAFFLVLKLASPASLGTGDVKLSPIIGAYLGFLGWSTWTTGLLATFASNAAVGVAILVLRRGGRSTHLPFAPFMGLGAVVAIVVTRMGP